MSIRERVWSCPAAPAQLRTRPIDEMSLVSRLPNVAGRAVHENWVELDS